MVNQLEGWKEGTAKLPHLGRHGPRGPPFARATALRSMHEDGRHEPGDGLEQLIEEQNPNFLGPEIDIF